MTVKECYELMGGDYEGVLSRLPGDNFIKKFAIKFLADPSFDNLDKALKEKNLEEAFRAAHTLKGVCQNLGFDDLFKVSSAITEVLRSGTMDGCDAMFKDVEEQYHRTADAIRKLEQG